MKNNKSLVYVYPMIEDAINYETNLLGCYIGDTTKPQYDNHILLRYKFEGNLASEYLKFEKEIQNYPLLKDFYDVEGDNKENSVMFVFNVPEEYKQDYQYFIESKYSKISEPTKQKIIKYHGTGNENNKKLLEGILYKTKEYKKILEDKIGATLPYTAEFSSSWDRDNEYFTPNYTSNLT